MNIAARTPSQTFLVFHIENWIDPIVCRGADDVRDAISNLDGLPFQVLTIGVDEFCRDVTDEFRVEEYPEFDRMCSAADDRYQASREAGI
jgi:hypothetical protein